MSDEEIKIGRILRNETRKIIEAEKSKTKDVEKVFIYTTLLGFLRHIGENTDLGLEHEKRIAYLEKTIKEMEGSKKHG